MRAWKTGTALAALCTLLALVTPSDAAAPVEGTHSIGKRSAGAVSLAERSSCRDGGKASPNAVDTTGRLARLRAQMRDAGITAYIVTSNDDHQSEYIATHDRRREYISGFSGSSGDAVVTLEQAALWTDSRYFLQAEEQLDCSWLLMKSGISGVPTIKEWLVEQLQKGDNVSSDPRIAPYSEWVSWNTTLEKAGVHLVLHTENLVDKIWSEQEGRPPYPNTPLFVHDIKFAGVSWQDKITAVRAVLKEKEADVLVVTALDEIAWALNLRGEDIPYTPVFRSYLLIGQTWVYLYLPSDKITDTVEEHLNSRDTNKSMAVRVKTYEDIWTDLPKVAETLKIILLPSALSYAKGASYLIYHSLPAEKVNFSFSPLLIMKDIKNSVEAEGMWTAHIRDAVALCQILRLIEEGVAAGEDWDELRVVEQVDYLRKNQLYNKGPSFDTIAAFGSNAALPHYSPTAETNAKINTSNVFMLDSGGQYLDGTTDVTRTIHLGTPTPLQRSVYTKLLMGCIDIVSTSFPAGQTLSQLEILIRAPLYSLGLDYGHGSTHGIGSFLGVHEAFNTTYHENFFGSQEPGFYKDNDFGMRLENIITVVSTNMTFQDKRFLTFEAVTLVPYEEKLIDVTLMSDEQLRWLNNYHDKVRQLVGKEMIRQGLLDVYAWLYQKTEPISKVPGSSCISNTIVTGL